MINWYEPVPGFVIPKSFTYDPNRWPDYTTSWYQSRLATADEFIDTIKTPWDAVIDKRAWGAWFGAKRHDRPLKRGWPDLEKIADRVYSQSRYKTLTPLWSQKLTAVLTEIDDIQDQLATIIWVLEIIANKFLPVPPPLLHQASEFVAGLNIAATRLAGLSPVNALKSQYRAQRQDRSARLAAAKKHRNKLVLWLKENMGHLIEAAQATGQWFDFGIILGPIMGFIEEGFWYVAKSAGAMAKDDIDKYIAGFTGGWHQYGEDLFSQATAIEKDLFGRIENIDEGKYDEPGWEYYPSP